MAPGNPNGNSRMASMIAAAQAARAIGKRHYELLGWCRENWTRLDLPPLFSEVFDIPKSEEDPSAAYKNILMYGSASTSSSSSGFKG